MKKILYSLIICLNTVAAFASYDQALALYQGKKYQESLAMVADELVVADDYKENSPNYKLRYLAAHNHWKLGNDQSAVAHFRKCMSIKKSAIEPYIDCAMLLLEKQRFGDAASIAEDGLKLKDDPMLYWVLGRVAMARKDFWRAKELLEKANSLDPELYVSYNDLGIVLIQLNKAGDANTAFSVALAIYPDSAEANYNMAYSCLLLGRKNDAVLYSKRALELSPDNEVVKKLIQKIESDR
ncbi:MAG: tetratricopeptide repeat protein [Spirochaetes bacterium]|nr:tetratricopeptide repeat protein [Spirochaetota bacterium]